MTKLDRTAELMTDADIDEVSLHMTRILVPTDGSATAVEATKVAISLAKALGDVEIVALFVGPGRVEDPLEYTEQEMMEGVHHSEAGLDVAVKLGEKNGVRVSTVKREGAVTHEILYVAERYNVQMIVIGSSGRTGFKRLALGSVAHAVMNEAEVPVTVVKHCSTEFCMKPRS
jgi:nucleotide-binding universal stress UspA family protein